MSSGDTSPELLKAFHRIIMDTSAIWLNVLDKEARVVSWNRAAEQISGYSQEEVLGRDDIWEWLYPDAEYRNHVYAKAQAIINSGEAVVDFETTIRCKDGSHRTLSWNSHDVKDDSGAVIGSLAIARDVTDLHASHSQLEQMTRKLERSNKRLQKLSKLDELTGLNNRRSMDTFLEQEWKRHLRKALPLSLLYIDIDHFKLYNDTYGHHMGDDVLIQVAAILKRHAKRSIDMAARFGGEEFVIILPETSHSDALALAEAIRRAVEASQIEHKGLEGGRTLTASIGVATRVPHAADPIRKLQNEADLALYMAKSQGRNRVVSAAGAGSGPQQED